MKGTNNRTHSMLFERLMTLRSSIPPPSGWMGCNGSLAVIAPADAPHDLRVLGGAKVFLPLAEAQGGEGLIPFRPVDRRHQRIPLEVDRTPIAERLLDAHAPVRLHPVDQMREVLLPDRPSRSELRFVETRDDLTRRVTPIHRERDFAPDERLGGFEDIRSKSRFEP